MTFRRISLALDGLEVVIPLDDGLCCLEPEAPALIAQMVGESDTALEWSADISVDPTSFLEGDAFLTISHGDAAHEVAGDHWRGVMYLDDITVCGGRFAWHGTGEFWPDGSGEPGTGTPAELAINAAC